MLLHIFESYLVSLVVVVYCIKLVNGSKLLIQPTYWTAKSKDTWDWNCRLKNANIVGAEPAFKIWVVKLTKKKKKKKSVLGLEGFGLGTRSAP